MMISYRGTGRTTRILLKASIEISRNPKKHVLVFAHSINYAKDLCKDLYDLCKFCGIPIEQKQLIPKSYQSNSKNIVFDNKIVVEDHYINLMK